MNVLILCTANSARSILAEALLNQLGAGRFRAFSAGSRPGGQVNPAALRTLAAMGIAAPDARSKSWDEFAGPDAPRMDLVITVCDSAANETCPVWPGAPLRVNWAIADPAAAPAERRDQAFYDAALQLRRRIERLVALPIERLSAQALRDIHHSA